MQLRNIKYIFRVQINDIKLATFSEIILQEHGEKIRFCTKISLDNNILSIQFKDVKGEDMIPLAMLKFNHIICTPNIIVSFNIPKFMMQSFVLSS